MKFEYERPGDFKVLLEDSDLDILRGAGARYIYGIRCGLNGVLWSKVSIEVDNKDMDRVEFDSGMDMHIYITSNEIFPVEIDRTMLDPSGSLDERREKLQHYFGHSGSVVVDLA